tara:strand:- start:3204 stop:3647 length:444 start_codon:yes stop_codon:yes gene_type:complete
MKKSNEWMIVKSSKVHGKGGFAKKDIPKDTYIIEYVGKKITNKEADKISEKECSKGIVYLFGLNKRYTLDGDTPTNIAKYINHSCNPNAESLNDNGRIWITALKDIKKGEEINYDYCLETDDIEDHPCKCGEKNCKKYIVTKIKNKK